MVKYPLVKYILGTSQHSLSTHRWAITHPVTYHESPEWLSRYLPCPLPCGRHCSRPSDQNSSQTQCNISRFYAISHLTPQPWPDENISFWGPTQLEGGSVSVSCISQGQVRLLAHRTGLKGKRTWGEPAHFLSQDNERVSTGHVSHWQAKSL